MKKILILVALLVVISAVFSINFIPASGEEVPLESRNEQIYFHNFIHEYNWEGPSSWAVRFNIEDFYGSDDEVVFTPDGVDFFYSSLEQFPISLSLRNSLNSQPNDTILVETAFDADEVAYGWNHWSFEGNFSGTEFWLVMDFATNPVNRFIPGSYGSGEHSYYRNDEGVYVELDRYCEFLVNLTGELSPVTAVNDIWVEEFYLPDNQENELELYPILKIKANTISEDESVDDVWINYQRVSPFRAYSPDSIWVGTMVDDEIIEIDFSDPAYTQLALLNEADNSEYSMIASINSSSDGFLFNNNAVINIEDLPRSVDKLLVENSVRLDHNLSEMMWYEEEVALQDYDVEVLNYFPDIADSLYTQAAALRSLFYQFSLYPVCVANGDRKINGIVSSEVFRDSLQSYLDGAEDRTVKLLSDFEVEATADLNDSVFVSIKMKNNQANYFSSRLSQSTLFVAVVEDNFPALPLMYGSVMLDMVYELEGSQFIMLTPSSFETFETSFSFYKSDLDTFSENEDNLRLFAWLQNTETKEIHHIRTLGFNEFDQTSSSSEDVPESSFSVTVYPNPFNGEEDLQVEFQGLDRNIVKSEVKIYNVKGQLIRKIEGEQDRTDKLSWDGKDSSNNKVASGVYLLKIAVNDGKTVQTRNKKCLILNK